MKDVRVFEKTNEEESGILRNYQDLGPVVIEISLQEDLGVLLDNLINVPINLFVQRKRLKENVGIDKKIQGNIVQSKEKGSKRRLTRLRFRNIQDFNTALLANQLWRLIFQSNLLMSKVLKGKYYPK